MEMVANRVLDDARSSSFIENVGQIHNPDVRFYVVSRDLQAGFAESSLLLKIVETASSSIGDERHPMMSTAQLPGSGTLRGVMLRLRFEGANDVSPQARDPRPHLSQFFLGSDAAQWRTGVRDYGEVVYEDLYAGVDLIYRATPAGVKYEFHVRAGASPEPITLVYEGADRVELDGSGNTWIHTPVGNLTDSAPIAYQGTDQVPCAFVLRGPRSYGLLCQGVDGSRPLVIDPLLTATFLGGGGIEGGNAIAVDMDGNAYVTGTTESGDFPASPGAFNQTLSGRVDAFVAKLDRTLSFRIYMTYLGGVGEDRGLSIAIGAGGSVYVTGTTNSADFPTTPSAFDRMCGTDGNCDFDGLGYYGDAFVAKLNATGTGLIYATYLGGGGEDRGHSVAAGPGGGVFLTGNTSSADFPTTAGAMNVTYLGGASDAFVAKFDLAGGTLDYATYLGGAGNESGLSIAVDSGGNAYLTGMADSASFPATAGVIQETFGGGPRDAFVVKLNPAGNSMLYATFLGGSGIDDGSGIAVDGAGNAYVTGSTVDAVTDLNTTVGANDTTHNGNTDAFVAKVDPTGTDLLYATFLGGAAHDYGYGIAVDGAGNAYVAGRTNSDAFPTTPDAISPGKNGAHDGFVTRLSAGGVALNYSTFLGGLNIDFAKSIALDPAGNVYVTGETESPDLPVTPGAWDTDLDNSSSNPLNWTDAFVAKFVWPSAELSVVPPDIALVPPGPAIAGTVVTISATVRNLGDGDASQVWVRFHDGPPSGSNQIGTDQLIPLITALGGAGNATVDWTAWRPGSHDVCVSVDPGDDIAETNETNNIACAQVLVVSVAPVPVVVGGVLSWILLLGTISVGALLGLNESLRVSFLTTFVILWARLSRSDILDNKKRGMVVGYLAANPAANFAAIRADLNMAMGTLTYHLWVLEKEGEIKSWRDGRFRRYAPHGHRVAEMQPTLTDIELLLLQRIRGTSGRTQKELAKDVGVSQPAVSYHMARMAQMGIITVERRGRAKRYTANLEVPGDAGPQVDPGDVPDFEPPEETDEWRARR